MTMSPVLEKLYAPIRPQLERVRHTVGGMWWDALGLVHGPRTSDGETGGKLLRPAMALLTAAAIGGRDLDRFVGLASTFEVLHLAALVHDDVIDRADLRRGVTSLNALWDDRTAVLGGDYLVARATTLLTPYDSCALIAEVVESVRQMAEGELRSIGRGPAQFTKDDCIQLARQKTASLFASTCTGPTFLVECNCREALRRFGFGFGIAFQLADDLLDLSQTEEKLGKPSCGDVVEGKTTLPILYMRQAMGEEELARFDAMSGSPLAEDDRAWIVEAIERTGARRKTEETAEAYVQDARDALGEVPDSLYRDSLLGLLDFVLVRRS